MTLHQLDAKARAVGLAVRGAFHPTDSDNTPPGTKTLVLLGPDEPSFWPIFEASPEMTDGAQHPLDRWSKRVTGELSALFHATAIFPYDGPPYAPFLHWAERCGTSWSSPIGLLVHETAGLFISFRAALAVAERLPIAGTPQNPCRSCSAQPCASACPVGALAPGKDYDVPACKAHLESPEGAACRAGCLVRRACPVSQRFGRPAEQSAFHMRAFLGE
ncbi:ferredoxin [Marivita hallyeonensis]|uniref:4Fe-4S ferredoxin-type domain-containing protein n=1 Tax=Marivita hallyeonensis TaxID=996342 RepID=A0A1M5N6B9_9RHOB|nr:ferredoxin [Marivita hallyeonensis]SHG85015.1 hypothetical protein SAMN05443551_0784 [Marivita hallyeonensis]